MTNLSDYYLNEWKLYKEKFDKIALLMQVGSFYEILESHDNVVGNAREISEVLNIILTKKNKGLSDSPFMCGFPCVSLTKYLPVLISNDYTVVRIDQDPTIKGDRKVTQIYSSSTPPDDLLTQKEPILMSIYIDQTTNVIGVSLTNTATGQIEIGEFYENSLERLYTFIRSRYPSEIVSSNFTEIQLKFLELETVCHRVLLDPKYKTVRVQEEYFKTIYKSVFEGSMLGYIVDLDLDKLTTCGTLSLINLFDFLYIHNEKLLRSPQKPNVIKENERLYLSMNTSEQLNILDKNTVKSSVFSVINFTQTVLGRRALKKILSNPLISVDEIVWRYSLSNKLKDYSQETLSKIKSLLCQIKDITSYHRSIQCGSLTPQKFWNLHTSYINITHLLSVLKEDFTKQFGLNQTTLHKFIESYSSILDTGSVTSSISTSVTASVTSSISTSVTASVSTSHDTLQFKKGIDRTLDTLLEKVRKAETRLNEIEEEVSLVAPVKLGYSETEMKWVLMTTNIRGAAIKNKYNNQFTYISNKSGTKIFSEEMEQLSETILTNHVSIDKRKRDLFTKLQTEWASKYFALFREVSTFVEILDITYSNVVASKRYNYICPEITDTSTEGTSFIDTKDLRHPLIERIIDTEYIPNDISLGNGSPLGGIIYSLNSGGKSSLLRSVGVSVILAQSGLFVPASSFKYYPFKKLISQVDFVDNLFKSQSSFVSEMIGLKTILRESNCETLVLADELCKGSEINSATAIFASATGSLIKNEAKFLMSTHLHGVSELDSIQQYQKESLLGIWNLGVEITPDNTIVFLRKLERGPCDTLYGLEIAKALGLDESFIKNAFYIRNKITKRKETPLRTKGTKYNSQKLMNNCEICEYTPVSKTDIPLDCHHIEFQCNAENNFNRHFHKNSIGNLVCLCKSCHQKVHSGEIEIMGWKQTTKGKLLHYKVQTG
jgi:DNA mismatch repair protein MutS